jgi:hypothetical protein
MFGKKKPSIVGKRVISLSFLEKKLAVYGTVMSTERVSKRVEYWQVHTSQGINIDAPSTHFEVYEYEELHPGDKIHYLLDEGGYWEGIVLYPHAGLDHQVCFFVQITSWEHGAIKVPDGYQFSAQPYKFKKNRE